MKNKKTLYILIPAVLIIWGLIVYKIFSWSDDPGTDTLLPVTKKPLPVTDSVDKSVIHANYPDPFLKDKTYKAQGTVPAGNKVANVTNSDNKKTTVVVKTPPVAKWPKIRYDGLIINKNSGEKTGIIYINDKSKLVYQNSEINGLEIIHMTQDSVVIRLNDELRSFVRGAPNL